MDEAELGRIRKARLEQLKAQSDASGSFAGGSSDQHQNAERQQQESDARAGLLAQILEPDAADRLGRIRLVKEARATEVEDRLLMLARAGQLRAKVTEEQLKEFLLAVAEQHEKSAGEKIVVSRRKGWDGDDDDDFFD